MTQVNLTKIANLLVDTFVSIEEVSVVMNHIFITYHSTTNELDIIYAPIPDSDDNLTVATLLLNLQNQVLKNTHTCYLKSVQ